MVDLSESMNISRSFNVSDLYEYREKAQSYPDDNSRTSSFQVRETDWEVAERFMEEWDRKNTSRKTEVDRPNNQAWINAQ